MKTITTRRALLTLTVLAGFTAALSSCGTETEEAPKEEPKYDDCYVLDEEGVEVVDCARPGCGQAPECKAGCSSQLACVSAISSDNKIDRICAAGACTSSGPRDDEGAIRRGGLFVNLVFDRNVNVANLNKKGYVTTVHHGLRPGGGALACKDLLRVDADDPNESNVVARTFGQVLNLNEGDILRTSIRNIPVPESAHPHLVLTRFFSVFMDSKTKEPGGLVYAQACKAIGEIVEGPLPEKADEAHSLDLEVFNACDVKDPNSCQDGKQCVKGAGFCRYVCEGCAANQVCRPPRAGAEPQCLLECDPDRGKLCPAGEMPRCDTTPGEDPACLPDD